MSAHSWSVRSSLKLRHGSAMGRRRIRTIRGTRENSARRQQSTTNRAHALRMAPPFSLRQVQPRAHAGGFGASALTYSKCLKPTEYFRSPNDDTPCRQFLSLARAALIQSDHVSGRAATASRIEPSSDLRFIRSSSFKPRAPRPPLIKVADQCTNRLRGGWQTDAGGRH
jgi:hypothetical protein